MCTYRNGVVKPLDRRPARTDTPCTWTRATSWSTWDECCVAERTTSATVSPITSSPRSTPTPGSGSRTGCVRSTASNGQRCGAGSACPAPARGAWPTTGNGSVAQPPSRSPGAATAATASRPVDGPLVDIDRLRRLVPSLTAPLQPTVPEQQLPNSDLLSDLREGAPASITRGAACYRLALRTVKLPHSTRRGILSCQAEPGDLDVHKRRQPHQSNTAAIGAERNQTLGLPHATTDTTGDRDKRSTR